MRPIRLYLAGATGIAAEWEHEIEFVKCNIRNRMVSFAYPGHLAKWIEVTGRRKGNIILDSGAFSAWGSGVTIDIREYIQYCREAARICKKNRKDLRIVNLDVIPGKAEKGKKGKKGETENLNRFVVSRKQMRLNRETIERAAREGYENCKTMINEGENPIHIFHQGEGWKWLDRMVELLDYIGLSPANDLSLKEQRIWIDLVFTYLYRHGVDIKIHGFAAATFEIIRDYPWASCDSTTPTLAGAYGRIYIPHQGYENPNFDFDKSRRPFYLVTVSNKRVKHIPPKIAELLETSGYSIEEIQSSYAIRKTLNLKFILLLEQYLNQYKTGRKYEPKRHPTLF